jgi:hypothetical protein
MSSAQVNRPTNIALKEADVNRKLQLYGIFAGRLSSLFQALPILTNYSFKLSKLAKSHP